MKYFDRNNNILTDTILGMTHVRTLNEFVFHIFHTYKFTKMDKSNIKITDKTTQKELSFVQKNTEYSNINFAENVNDKSCIKITDNTIQKELNLN